jgi:hypothetical protein
MDRFQYRFSGNMSETIASGKRKAYVRSHIERQVNRVLHLRYA